MTQQLSEKIEQRTLTVGIIGLGYVGLPLAIACINHGINAVICIEKDEKKLTLLRSGKSYINDISDEEIQRAIAQGFECTDDAGRLKQADVILICVPTPIDEHKVPDLTPVREAAKMIGARLQKGQMVILESTVYPGCTEEFVQPILEKESGLSAREDFYLVFSPERVDPNNTSYPTEKIPRVIGGLTAEATDLAAAFYEIFTPPPFKVSSPKVAEMSKILENMFRLVNISMINELSLLCGKLDIDIWETIEAAKTKPYGFMPFYPGPGVGGHCISVDPFYLSWKAKEVGFYPRFIELAGQINDLMTHSTVTKVIWALNQHKKALNGSRILVIGITYKRDVADLRDSPALKIMADLMKKHAVLSYHDPFIENVSLEGHTLHSTPLTTEQLNQSDLVLILTDHSALDYERIIQEAPLIVDTRNILREKRTTIIR